jgi:hypothetical protein
MLLKQAIAGMLQLFSVLFILATGGLLVGLAWVPEWLFAWEYLLVKPQVLATAGFCVLGFGWLVTLGFLWAGRGKSLLLRIGGASRVGEPGSKYTSVGCSVIRKTMAPLLQEQFGSRVKLDQVQILRGKSLNLKLRLSPMSGEEREKILLQAEYHLQTLLAERFGYSEPFTLQASV